MCRSRSSLNAAVILVLGAILLSAPVRGSDPPHEGSSVPNSLIGFVARSAEKQREAEAHALTVPTPDNARRWLRILTSEPHVAGTPADYKTAVFVRDKLREWGWKADISEMEVLLNYPDPPSLNLVRPTSRALNLDEAPIASDKDSASTKAFGAFNGYGASGDVSGQVVYANYGRPEDFAALDKMGIDVKDKVVLVRYGELFRGLKVWNAQKRGAKGILIFSDPADDGYARGDVYPHGRFRPGSAIQRGSVQFLSLGPGDPSTPFGPSVKGAKRLPLSERQLTAEVVFQRRSPANRDLFPPCLNDADWEKQTGLKLVDTIAIIPSLPIGYDTAHEILKVLAGPNVPSGWQGGLPQAYHVGPGPAEVHLSVSMDYKIRPIWNVIATIPGTVEPDRWVMIGNHRDAWVYGAVDPSSGTAATLEMCRAIGEAVKRGWKPRRTLVYASWDAEEYGLVGSTEWAEEHAEEVQKKAVLMLNVDSAVAGPELTLSGVPSLRDFVLEATGAITDVRSGRTLRSEWTEGRRKAWASSTPLVLQDPLWDNKGSGSPGSQSTSTREFVAQMNWLGSGSDYTAFVDHLGIPVVDGGLRGGYGVYHSVYDDFNWMEKFGDPEFLNHATAARLYTLIAMRAAAADVAPLRFVPYGLALREHVDELRLIHARRIRQDESAKSKPAAEFEGVLDLVRAVRDFQGQAEAFDRAIEALTRHDSIATEKLVALNDTILKIERAFLFEAGLPGRTWFKHAIYAPGLTTGYAAWPLPAIRQALEDKNPAQLSAAVTRTVERMEKAADALKKAADQAHAAGNGR
jgi:N-acetylated-alpha-linked acidic dipeptidase